MPIGLLDAHYHGKAIVLVTMVSSHRQPHSGMLVKGKRAGEYIVSLNIRPLTVENDVIFR